MGRTAALLFGTALFAGAVQAAVITFSFTLPVTSPSYKTSAGVYNGGGQLVRTLWSNQTKNAGLNTAVWDGYLDAPAIGQAAPPASPVGTYTIKVLYHNVAYVWEGVVGNTGASFTSAAGGGDAVWHGFDRINDMAINGTDMFMANGYAEGNSNAFRAVVSAANAPKQMVFANNIADAAAQFQQVASDGNLVYFANANNGFSNSSESANDSFVVAYNVSDNGEHLFSSGIAIQPISWGPTFDSAIDVTATAGANPTINPPTGLAVQQTGSILAVAHGGANQIRLFNKTSGAPVGTISVANPGKIAFNPNTNDLWVVTGATVQRFSGATLGSTQTPVATIGGFASPLAVGVDPRPGCDIVMIADGGASQQIKAYNSAGSPLWTYGVAGGYSAANGPAVTNDKFAFGGGFQGYLAVQSDGSFWVGDPGNFRNLHFSGARAYLEQSAYVPANYVCSVDPNAPTRVIAGGWLEYQVDYTKPLLAGDPQAASGNGSWKLVKNWGLGVPAQYLEGGALNYKEGIGTVVTLTNGRVYGLVFRYDTGNREVVELPSGGSLRFTGIQVPGTASLYANGDLRDFSTAGEVQTITRRRLTGFDASGNPVWGTAATLASVPAAANDPCYRGYFPGSAAPQFPITVSNNVITFDQSVDIEANGVVVTPGNPGMHLGGVSISGASWKWKAGPAAASWDYANPTVHNGTHVIGNVNYGGNKVVSSGRNIVCGYHGEGWNGGQANQFMHFLDDGLFVGEWGIPYMSGSTPNQPGGAAGNAYSSELVTAGGKTYLWHGDESVHGGTHRWRIDNLGSIAEAAGSGALGSTIALVDIPNVADVLRSQPAPVAGALTVGGEAFSWGAASGGNWLVSLNGGANSGGCGAGIALFNNGGKVQLVNAQGWWYQWNGSPYLSSWTMVSPTKIGASPLLPARSTGTLVIGPNTWSWGAGIGGNWLVSLNGSANSGSGGAGVALFNHNGKVQLVNAQGWWYEWNGSTSAPAWNLVYPPTL